MPGSHRILLVNPPAREPVRSPLLAFGYLAASLKAEGHEVFVLDAAARPGAEVETIAQEIIASQADVVGMHLKTLEVQRAYELVGAIRQLDPTIKLVAGGPHATVRPFEALNHGFDVTFIGEAELSFVEFLRAESPGQVAGLAWRDRGLLRRSASRDFIRALDALPSPLTALDCFDQRDFPAKAKGYAGLLSSRGCPAACTFCANQVTGRSFRFRSPEAVANEVRALRDLGTPAFSFFDDSFAVGRVRVQKLCDALSGLGIGWTCTAHPAHLDQAVLEAMKRAGCGGIDLGIESGDARRLLRIGKGVTTERVLEVLECAADLGLHTVVNLMVGFPEESERELEATLTFLERAAPLARAFNARGALVPHPETPEYEEYHARFGFTEWWLHEPPLSYLAFPSEWSLTEVLRAYAEDAALERNFYGYPESQLSLAREILRRKAEHTLLGLDHLAPQSVPAAGAR